MPIYAELLLWTALAAVVGTVLVAAIVAGVDWVVRVCGWPGDE